MSEEYDTCPDPLWCEDCLHYKDYGLGTEGECDIDGHYTCYCDQICKDFCRNTKGRIYEQREAD